MADPVYSAAPQVFSFRGRKLSGFLIGWSGQSPRRHVIHEFPKRRGARVEDMADGPRRMDVRLVFLGPQKSGDQANPAKDFADFEAFIRENPRGLLVHPVAGKWQAFCAGPAHSVSFDQAVDRIEVPVTFIESELDAAAPKDVPDVATAAQNATAQQSKFQSTTATFMGALGKAQAFTSQAIAQIDSALAVVDTVTAPMDLMASTITATGGVAQSAIGKILSIQRKGNVLVSSVTNYINAATDVFNGADTPAGSSDATSTLLGVVQTTAEDLNQEQIAASPSPAGAGDAVGDVEEMVSLSLVLKEALQAARPPEIIITVPELTDLVSLCVKRYKVNPLARASDIMGLNRITNPAAIPAGTRLRAPSR